MPGLAVKTMTAQLCRIVNGSVKLQIGVDHALNLRPMRQGGRKVLIQWGPAMHDQQKPVSRQHSASREMFTFRAQRFESSHCDILQGPEGGVLYTDCHWRREEWVQVV